MIPAKLPPTAPPTPAIFDADLLGVSGWFNIGRLPVPVERNQTTQAWASEKNVDLVKAFLKSTDFSQTIQFWPMWTVRIRHCSHHFATQSSHFVDRVERCSQNGFHWILDTMTWCTRPHICIRWCPPKRNLWAFRCSRRVWWWWLEVKIRTRTWSNWGDGSVWVNKKFRWHICSWPLWPTVMLKVKNSRLWNDLQFRLNWTVCSKCAIHCH